MKKQLLFFVVGVTMTFTALADKAIYVSETGEKLIASFSNQGKNVSVTLPNKKKVKLHSDPNPAASGARYVNGNKEFWEHHGEVTYSVDDETIFTGKELETGSEK